MKAKDLKPGNYKITPIAQTKEVKVVKVDKDSVIFDVVENGKPVREKQHLNDFLNFYRIEKA